MKPKDAHLCGEKADYYIDVLRATELFQSLPEGDLLQLLKFSQRCKFRTDEQIFSDDNISDCMYVVIDGEVAIEKNGEHAYQQLARYADNDFFGESGLFLSIKRGANARAIRTTNLIRFPASSVTFQSMARTHPVLCNSIFNILITHVSRRIRSVNQLISKRKHWVSTLKEQLIIDKITGLYTVGSYHEEFLSQLADGRPVIAAMIKPRNFKMINDTFGHEVGDAVLHKMGSICIAAVAGKGRPFRYLGNEFAFVFHAPDSIDTVNALIERTINNMSILDLRPLGVSGDIKLSFMSCIAQYPQQHSDLSSLLDYAHARFMEIFSRDS